MSNWPPLRDYGRSLAVMIGTWDYRFLDRVPAAEHSLRRMERLLTGPLCGWPPERMLMLPNVPSPGDLPDRLITAFDAVTDVAVFYFVGHGQISPDDQLCLGLVQSRPEPNRRAATSLRFADVRQALQDSSAAVKIVILDCCFAGLATKGTLAGLAGDVLDLTAGTEPTAGLDANLGRVLMEQIRELANDARTTFVFTPSLADLDLCDRLLVLAPGGATAFYGPPDEGLSFFGLQGWTEVLRVFEQYPSRDWAAEFAASPAYAQWVLGPRRGTTAQPSGADAPTQYPLPQLGPGRHRRQ